MRGIATNITLLLGTVVWFLGVLVLAEYAMRWAEPNYLAEISLDDVNYLHEYSELYGWTPRANFQHKIGFADTRINRAGYRGHLYPREHREDSIRVVLLGDSIAFGYLQPDHEIMSTYLEEKGGYEVINLAVQGYGTDQALLKLLYEGLSYNPDIVFLHVCLQNDFDDNVSSKYYHDGIYPKPYYTLEEGELRLHDAHVKLSLVEKLQFNLYVKSVLFHRLVRFFGRDPVALRKALVQAPQPRDENEELTYALIERMSRRVSGAGARFVVLLYPTQEMLGTDSQRVRGFFESPRLRGIRMHNVHELLVAHGMTEDNYSEYAFDEYPHLTFKGHEVLANVMHDFSQAKAGAVQ